MKVALAICLVALAAVSVNAHGRLRKPAGRGTAWRDAEFRSQNPNPDYNDNQLFCGGVWVQYGENNGQCGICGDPWNEPAPRAHEHGGAFGQGIITGKYQAGQVIDISVELTAAHLGYFEFRLCPEASATQDCLNRNVLELADGSGTKYPIPPAGTGLHNYRLVLPAGVTCEQCTLQWHYRTGNSHGICDDGSSQLGCGNQEIFRGCADIAIN